MEKDFIGVFDSGVGGISVLQALVCALPNENFIYYGDSAHAPYGEKSIQEIQELSMNIIDMFVRRGAKAIVIACNTATSAAAALARERYPGLPILGVEPAVKPAASRHKNILVMATEMTLKLEKFAKLMDTLEGSAEFIPAVCTGLAARIEKGNLEAGDLIELLHSLLDPYRNQVDCVVLGCTHYPFVKKQIREVLGDIPFYDGAEGTARHLVEKLERVYGVSGKKSAGTVSFESSLSTEKELALYQEMFLRKDSL